MPPDLRRFAVWTGVASGLVLGAIAAVAAPGDWRDDHPGVWHEIKADALAKPYATRSAGNGPREVPPPAGAMPQVPAGFGVTRFAEKLDAPRAMTVAPNGDVFVAETAAGQIRVLRARPGATKADSVSITWPSGATATENSLAAGQIYHITESSKAMPNQRPFGQPYKPAAQVSSLSPSHSAMH